MKAAKLSYDNLSALAQGYADAVLETNGFWPDEDRKEIRKWESRGTDSFAPDACASIAAACDSALVVLAVELGGVDAMIKAFDGLWGELGEALWHCRQGSGHEPSFRSSRVDRAVMLASRKIGEAYVEIGRGRISHSDHAPSRAAKYITVLEANRP